MRRVPHATRPFDSLRDTRRLSILLVQLHDLLPQTTSFRSFRMPKKKKKKKIFFSSFPSPFLLFLVALVPTDGHLLTVPRRGKLGRTTNGHFELLSPIRSAKGMFIRLSKLTLTFDFPALFTFFFLALFFFGSSAGSVSTSVTSPDTSSPNDSSRGSGNTGLSGGGGLNIGKTKGKLPRTWNLIPTVVKLHRRGRRHHERRQDESPHQEANGSRPTISQSSRLPKEEKDLPFLVNHGIRPL